MKIGLYICDILYSTGGTESYTVKLCYALQCIYPEAQITFVTERYAKTVAPSSSDFIISVNGKYGTDIDTERAKLLPVPANKSNKTGTIRLRRRLVKASKQFDLFFYCSRGNYVFKAKQNIHIIHFPTKPIAVQKAGANPLLIWYEKQKDRAYIKGYDLFLPNSQFTEKHFKHIWQGIDDKKLRCATTLCYHAVIPVPGMTAGYKEKIILVLSRIEKSKLLETLIDAYKSSNSLMETYRLVIAGGLTESLQPYLKELQEQAGKANIEFIVNAPFSKIAELYNRAELFWHCKGYGVDESAEPELMEHFGMSTVEAMSAGCVPVVINAAGQKEIVTEECGCRWNTTEELVRLTENLSRDPERIKRMALAARERAKQFSLEKFIENMRRILDTLPPRKA